MKVRLHRLSFGIIFLSIFFAASATPLYAQTEIEEATRAAGRLPEKEKIEEELKKPPEEPAEVTPLEAPAKKEEKKFFVSEIKLDGCESFPPKDFSSIVKKYENKEVALSELGALAKELEGEYLRRGIIAAVFVPPQDIKDGVATLRVIEARMGELQIQDHKYFKKKRLNYYWRVPPGKILRYDRISKSIQMMNKNPDREVKAALHAGKKPGTTDILLTPKPRFPIHLTSTIDKEGVVSTGTTRIGLGVRHNNLLGLDDMLITGHTYGSAFGGSYVYHVLPVSSHGTSLLYGYSKSRATPRKEFETTGLIAKAENISFSVRQDLYKKDTYLGEVFAGFDAKDKTIKLDTGVFNRDRLRVVSLGGNLVKRGLGRATYFSPEFSQGLYAFGATRKNNRLASRGAKPTFSKFNLGIQHKESLPLDLQANLKFKGQVSANDLMPQEQFSLGGIDSVRGYPAGDFLADNGFSDSAELLFPSFFIPKNCPLLFFMQERPTSLIFIDHGYGWRRGANSTELQSANYMGAGAGLRMKLFDQAFLRLEWGFPLHDKKMGTEDGKSQFHFSMDFEDRFPEKIENLKKWWQEWQEKKGDKKVRAVKEVEEVKEAKEAKEVKKVKKVKEAKEAKKTEPRVFEQAGEISPPVEVPVPEPPVFEQVQEVLSDEEKEAMAIVHFEIGNILYRDGALERAQGEWDKAMVLTRDPRMIAYINEAKDIAREANR